MAIEREQAVSNIIKSEMQLKTLFNISNLANITADLADGFNGGITPQLEGVDYLPFLLRELCSQCIDLPYLR